MLRKFSNQRYRNQLVTKIAALGVPSFVLLVAIAITSGDTPIKTALAFLGSFTGMLGGIVLLIIMGLVANNYLKYKPEEIKNNCNCKEENKSYSAESIIKEVIEILEKVPGITPAHHRDFNSSQIVIRLQDGSTVRTWKNPLGVDHIFLADKDGIILYGGFVGWVHSKGLNQTINQIRRDYS